MKNIRIGYSLFIISFIVVSYFIYPKINEADEALNLTSYIGTISTIVALVVTLSEVLYSVRRTKSIQEESYALLEEVKSVELASSISDCIASIDKVTNSVYEDKYGYALNNYHHFRTICAKAIPGFSVRIEDHEHSLLSDVELHLLKASKTSPSSPYSKRQKIDLQKKILLIKDQLEQSNPASTEKVN